MQFMHLQTMYQSWAKLLYFSLKIFRIFWKKFKFGYLNTVNVIKFRIKLISVLDHDQLSRYHISKTLRVVTSTLRRWHMVLILSCQTRMGHTFMTPTKNGPFFYPPPPPHSLHPQIQTTDIFFKSNRIHKHLIISTLPNSLLVWAS